MGAAGIIGDRNKTRDGGCNIEVKRMQTVYSTYYPMSKVQGKNAFDRHFKRKDSFERPEKRSPYDDASYRPSGSGRNGGRDSGSGMGCICITILLLFLLYPVGLFFLWSRKIRWSGGAKFLLTLVAGAVFCVLLVFALTYKTENLTVKRVQAAVSDAFDWVYEQTGGGIDAVGKWAGDRLNEAKDVALRAWDGMDEDVARLGLEAYSHVGPNIDAVKNRLPRLLLNQFKTWINYQEPVEDIVPIRQATPDRGVSVVGATQASPDAAEPQALPTLSPAETAMPAPTDTPEPTATPTPTPKPVTLPSIKEAAYAPVYFTAGGTYYHETKNCSGMMNAVSHTLGEAKAAGKQTCERCNVTPYSMLDCEHYLWVDGRRNVHTTDECPIFTGERYTLLPFEDVYEGGYVYCPTCGADVCYQYMVQNDEQFSLDGDADQELQALYNYERTITVYYSENSRSYHADTACQRMTNSKYVHTLYQALHVDKKNRCGLCHPITEEEARNAMTATKP